jgi:hypothetical protein
MCMGLRDKLREQIAIGACQGHLVDILSGLSKRKHDRVNHYVKVYWRDRQVTYANE